MPVIFRVNVPTWRPVGIFFYNRWAGAWASVLTEISYVVLPVAVQDVYVLCNIVGLRANRGHRVEQLLPAAVQQVHPVLDVVLAFNAHLLRPVSVVCHRAFAAKAQIKCHAHLRRGKLVGCTHSVQ